MRVHADLNRVHVQFANSPRFLFVDHHRVGLDLHVEHETPGVFDNLKEVAAHKNLAAAESEKENACRGQLIEHVLDFCGRHLAVVVVIEITMHAALVAAICNIHVHGDGDAQVKCFLAYFTHQAHRGASEPSGWSETRRIPSPESSATNCSASAWACSGSTSNCSQTWSRTISRRGVWPSAAWKMTVATSFRVKNVESAEFMTIISPASARAAMAELRAM